MNVIGICMDLAYKYELKLKRKNAPKEQINLEFKLNTQIKTRNK